MQGPDRDPYEVRGLDADATPDEIKAAYRRLAMKHHPDKNPDGKASEWIFREVNRAYETLQDISRGNRSTDRYRARRERQEHERAEREGRERDERTREQARRERQAQEDLDAQNNSSRKANDAGHVSNKCARDENRNTKTKKPCASTGNNSGSWACLCCY